MRYQVLTKSFIDGKVYDPEASEAPIYIEYDGIPGSNLKQAGPGQVPKRQSAAEVRARLKAAADSEDPSRAVVA
jgi:hypothetical protein